MTCSRVEQAARNNAVWCETICRVHGTPGEFHDTLWLNRHPVPRFYPNVVTTLATQTGMAAQLAHIQARSWRSACLAGVVSRTASARWIWRRLASSPCLTPPGCGVHRASPSPAGRLQGSSGPASKARPSWHSGKQPGAAAQRTIHLPGTRVSFCQHCSPIRSLSSLALAQEIGFTVLHPLRVWTR